MPAQQTALHGPLRRIAIGTGLASYLVVSQIALSALSPLSLGVVAGLAIFNMLPFVIIFTMMMKRVDRAEAFDNLVI